MRILHGKIYSNPKLKVLLRADYRKKDQERIPKIRYMDSLEEDIRRLGWRQVVKDKREWGEAGCESSPSPMWSEVC